MYVYTYQIRFRINPRNKYLEELSFIILRQVIVPEHLLDLLFPINQIAQLESLIAFSLVQEKAAPLVIARVKQVPRDNLLPIRLGIDAADLQLGELIVKKVVQSLHVLFYEGSVHRLAELELVRLGFGVKKPRES